MTVAHSHRRNVFQMIQKTESITSEKFVDNLSKGRCSGFHSTNFENSVSKAFSNIRAN